MIKWINVKAKLPKTYRTVLISTGNHFFTAFLTEGSEWIVSENIGYETPCDKEKIKYWAEIDVPDNTMEVENPTELAKFIFHKLPSLIKYKGELLFLRVEKDIYFFVQYVNEDMYPKITAKSASLAVAGNFMLEKLTALGICKDLSENNQKGNY